MTGRQNNMSKERILYEDKNIIVCHKASGIATQTARVGQADMVSEITNYLTLKAFHDAKAADGRRPQNKIETRGEKYSRDSQSTPYVGVVHRLDQPVEGILVFARNKQTAAELSRQITENYMEKYYYAVVCGHNFNKGGELTDYLLKDGRTNTSCIVLPEIKDARKAVLEYEILTEIPTERMFAMRSPSERSVSEVVSVADTNPLRLALARIRLHTGRHHQIRVQMSHAGMSLLGDYKYADTQTVGISEQMHVKEIALCAYRLTFWHPKTGKRMDFQIRPEGKSFQAEEFSAYYI